jgi:hypothetical protein
MEKQNHSCRTQAGNAADKPNRYSQDKISGCVWQNVVKIVVKNADFKTRLRAFGILEKGFF